ncbi:MAG TPA: hypothetical protein VGB42_03160 [Candidatus Thermoplasmatota archaeon]
MTISRNTTMLLVGVLAGATAFGAVAVAASTGGPLAMAGGLGMGAGMGGMMGGSMDGMMGVSMGAMMGGSHDAMMAGGTCPHSGDNPMDPAQCAEHMAAAGGCPMM